MCKKFIKKMNKKIGNMKFQDIALLKIAVIGFMLMIAKLWSPILSLEWYWYAIIFILPSIILVKKLKLLDLF